MAKLKKATFDDIVTAAEKFVNKQRGKWGEDEWLDLLAILKQLGVDLSDEMQAYVRQLVEAMRGVYQATGSTQGMSKALTSATKDSVEFVKVHKAIWGYSDWEDFAGHVKDNTRVISKETSSYLSEILASLKALLGNSAKSSGTETKKAPSTTRQAPREKPAQQAAAAPKRAAQRAAQPASAAPKPAAKPAAKPSNTKPEAKAKAKAKTTGTSSEQAKRTSTSSSTSSSSSTKAKPKAKPASAKPASTPAAAKSSAAPPPVSAAQTKAPASDKPDDLTAISGIGPALQKKLYDHGITQYAQIAGLSPADITHLEAEIIKFTGRIQRDGWLAQANELMNK